jgi:hypothetical protein
LIQEQFFLQSKVVSLASNPHLENQVPVFISPSDRVAKLYPQVPVSLFVAFYDSQGYGGGILTRLHTGFLTQYSIKVALLDKSKFRNFIPHTTNTGPGILVRFTKNKETFIIIFWI